MQGQTISHYEIREKLGEGGMGQVWKAKDTRLDRHVAIKILPEALSQSPELKQRLEREGRAISSLNHPHICTLFDIGSTPDGIDYLVMEYLEGQTISDRLKEGPMPLDEVYRTAIQIADALEKAHKQGVVHRDLKPGNVMLTPNGAKVLDFGLAKKTGITGPADDLTASPTMTRPLTAESAIVGTLQYMAPEQLEGKEADARSDLFAFGAMLYQMVGGQPPFAGESAASLIASVLKEQPRSLTEVAPITPPALDRLVRQCLAKDPDERWQTAGDLRRELSWLAEGPVTEPDAAPDAPPARSGREKLAWGLVLLLALAAITVGLGRLGSTTDGPQEAALVQAVLGVPPGVADPIVADVDLAVSPQGDRVVFVGGNRLWVRALDSIEFRELAGTEGATNPFWSPDGKRIGFFAGGRLRVIDAEGGPISTICDAPQGRGGSWNQAGTIIFSPELRVGIHRVPATGGEPVAVTTVEVPAHTTHRWPHFLPDGEHFLYLAANHNNPRGAHIGIHVASLSDGAGRFVVRSDTGAALDGGYLMYMRDGNLLAQRFDESTLALDANVLSLAPDVNYRGGSWTGMFSARNGLLSYQKRSTQVGGRMTWFDATGETVGTLGPEELFWDVQLSPDGRRVAVAQGEPEPSIWIYETDRDVGTRLTSDSRFSRSPIWSPDGTRIAYAAMNDDGWLNLYEMPADGSGAAQPLLQGDTDIIPTSWSPDGRFLALEYGPLGAGRIWILPLEGEQEPYAFVESGPWAGGGTFSPDGDWLAYLSRETGEDSVYVTAFPGPGGRRRISAGVYTETPIWSRDGDALFMLVEDRILSMEIGDGPGGELKIGETREFARFERIPSAFMGHNDMLAAAPDGRLLGALAESGDGGSRPIVVVAPWSVAAGLP